MSNDPNHYQEYQDDLDELQTIVAESFEAGIRDSGKNPDNYDFVALRFHLNGAIALTYKAAYDLGSEHASYTMLDAHQRSVDDWKQTVDDLRRRRLESL